MAEQVRRIAPNFQTGGLKAHVRAHGLRGPLVEAAQAFVLPMLRERDGEDGADFWRWMLENMVEALAAKPGSPVSLCDTFFVFDDAARVMVATASVVRDDRGWGERYGIEGLWFGGLNVRGDYRDRGLAAHLFDWRLRRVREWVGAGGPAVAINLFTKSERVGAMAERRGFRLAERFAPADEGQGTRHWRTVVERAGGRDLLRGGRADGGQR